jgi:hypothetical protein
MYVGKNLGGSPTALGSVTVYPASDIGLSNGGGSATINLRGKNSAPASASDGTLLGTASRTAATTTSFTIISTDLVTTYQYVWVEITAATGIIAASELRFFQPDTAGNMTLVTTMQTADSSVSNARVLLEFDNAASLSLNADLTVEVTCNGGTNWTLATLSAVTSNSQSGRKVAETADTACTSGTSFGARIKNANGKVAPIYGLSLTVH